MVKQGFLNLSKEEQEIVLEAALDEFSEKDYDAASLNHIISKAGISKGSMYHYFTNKEDLYLHMIELATEKKTLFLKSALTEIGKPIDEMDFFDNLEFQLKASIDFARSNYRYHQIGIRLQNMPDNDLKKKIWGRFRTAFEKYMDKIVDEAITSGEIRSDIGKEFVMRILQFVLMRFTEIYPDYGELMKKGDQEMWKEMHHLVEFLKNGLHKPALKEENR